MTKILLVEDDPMIAEIYERKFSLSGFEVRIAATGRAVLDFLKAEHFDIVLLDLVLPEMSGMEVLAKIRDPKEGYDPDIQVIVFSNLNEREDRERATTLGADGFIPKTEFSPVRLVEEVSRLFRQFKERLRHRDGMPVLEEGAVRKRILLIEDEEVFVELFGHRLGEEGYLVEHSGNGVDALRRALEADPPYDFIVSDVGVPGIDGSEVVARLKHDPRYEKVPMFLLSASSGDDPEFRGSYHAYDKYLLKTKITPSDLAYEVKAFLDRDRPVDSAETSLADVSGHPVPSLH